MKPTEAIILAKLIRNLECPLSQKQQFIDSVCKTFYELDQFFNVRKFKLIASQELPPDFYKRWGIQDDPNH